MKKAFLIFVALCATSVKTINAQQQIKGKVTNEAGEPIPFAAISIQNSLLSISSKSDGNYQFKNLKNGKFILETYCLGYLKQIDTIEINNADSEKNIVLKQSQVVIDEVLVQSTRANSNSGFAVSTLKKEDIEKQNLGQDVPVLLNNQTSIVSTSDAGTGIGYTGLRIRGSDATRVNITINGIPVNDAESQGVFWVNMPDLASSTGSIQIQRGVGSSTNGAGAFGGSVNIQTNTLQTKPYAEIINSGGSFNTLRTTLQAGTGLLNNRWAFDARASKISSDGFIDRSFSKLYSWYLSGGYYGKKTTIKTVAFSGKEKTYQSWWGVPETKLLNQPKDSLFNYLYNNLGFVAPVDTQNILNADPRTYNIYTYKNQTDNYKQDNYQLHFIHEFNKKYTLNVAAHYTKGKGYYEEYKYNQDLVNYKMDTVFTGNDTITTSNLIRRKWLNNDFYGIVYSLIAQPTNKLQFIFGGGANYYRGEHYGNVIWSRYTSNSEINHRYYFDVAYKTDINNYLKLNYQVNNRLSVFADLQYRFVNYNFVGIDNNFMDSTQTKDFHFFNPKGGFNFQLSDNSRIYGSFSRANREPSRDDFTENKYNKQPKHEELNDIEYGFQQQFSNISYGVNFYHMLYKNQLVLTGELNDVGNARRMNVDKSSRNGVELEVNAKINHYFSVFGNFTYSQNKIKNFNEIISNYDTADGVDTIFHSSTNIAFSPSSIASLSLQFNPVKNAEITLQNKYVGKQYLDNTSNENRKLDAYFVSDLRLSYLVKLKSIKELKFTVSINNLFNQLYSSNGYTYGWIYGGRNYTYNHYYPQAGTNVFGGISFKF
jgi:iron complex outermembrane receptor protein